MEHGIYNNDDRSIFFGMNSEFVKPILCVVPHSFFTSLTFDEHNMINNNKDSFRITFDILFINQKSKEIYTDRFKQRNVYSCDDASFCSYNIADSEKAIV